MAVTRGRSLRSDRRAIGQAVCRRILLVLCLSATAITMARAEDAPPILTAPVNDFAHIIDEDSARELDRRIRALQNATGDTVVVATVPTYKPYGDIREYATRMFENGGRGIGQKGKDNGLLIVVASDDRQIKIEPGYALEEFITDGFAGETIRYVIAPEFRNGRYGEGLLAGATRIINRIAERRGVTLSDVPQQPAVASRPQFPFSVIILIVLAVMILSRGGRRRRRRSYWGGGPWSGWSSGVGPFGGGGFGGGFGGSGGGFGGGGGGFGGFGGGRSGGGGASGGW